MNPDRLTGFVYPVKKNGVPVRGRVQLWANLPPEPAFARDGQPVLDDRRPCRVGHSHGMGA